MRILDWLDETGAAIVPVAYLCGLFLGTAAFFSGVHPAGLVLTVGLGLALGSEVHSFLQQRRARAAYAEVRRLMLAGTLGGGEGRAVAGARAVFRANVLLLVLLVVFQMFTATAFAMQTAPTLPGIVPDWAQGVRGLVVPLLFLASGFLLPLRQTPGAVLTRASDDILRRAVTRNVRHWDRRLKRAHRRGGDLSPLMVALLEEAGEHDAARRTTLIADTLSEAERTMGPGAFARVLGRGLRADTPVGAFLPTTTLAEWPELPEPPNDTPPTGPGTPRRSPRGPARGNERAHTASVRTPTSVRVQSGRVTRLSVEEQRALRAERLGRVAGWLEAEPRVATRELVRRLRRAEGNRSVSESTVLEMRRVIEARWDERRLPRAQ